MQIKEKDKMDLLHKSREMVIFDPKMYFNYGQDLWIDWYHVYSGGVRFIHVVSFEVVCEKGVFIPLSYP